MVFELSVFMLGIYLPKKPNENKLKFSSSCDKQCLFVYVNIKRVNTAIKWKWAEWFLLRVRDTNN